MIVNKTTRNGINQGESMDELMRIKLEMAELGWDIEENQAIQSPEKQSYFMSTPKTFMIITR